MTTERELKLEIVRGFAKTYAERLAKAGFTMNEARFIQPAVKQLFEDEYGVELEGILNGYFKQWFWNSFKTTKD